MKFFSIEDQWTDFNDELGTLKICTDDAKTEKIAHELYQQHLASLQGILPAQILMLDRLQGIEDGLLVEVKHDRDQKRVELTFRCGHLQMGYYDLKLKYEDAEISPEHERVLARIARTTHNYGKFESDLNCYELDIIEDGRIEHRILFHPGYWFAIRCRTLNWEIVDRPDQKLPELQDRFPGYPIFNLAGISEITKRPYLAWRGMCQGVECRFSWIGNLVIKNEDKQLYLNSADWLNDRVWQFEQYKKDSFCNHEHCMFCWQKIAEANCRDPDATHTAFMNRTIDEDDILDINWVCTSCFGQLRETFGWRVATPK